MHLDGIFEKLSTRMHRTENFRNMELWMFALKEENLVSYQQWRNGWLT